METQAQSNNSAISKIEAALANELGTLDDALELVLTKQRSEIMSARGTFY